MSRFLPRRPLAFSLRTLMVLVGGLCGWLAYERSVTLPRRDEIAYWNGVKGVAWRPSFPERTVGDPPRVSWLRGCFGD